MAPGLREQQGFSVTELMISLLLGTVIIGYSTVTIKDMFAIQKISNDVTILSKLEEDIRLALHLQTALKKSAIKNTNLANCLSDNGGTCRVRSTRFNLYLLDRAPLSGSYDRDGKKCRGNCLIQVQTSFLPICQSTPCKRANSLVFTYRIEVDGIPVKSGSVTKTNNHRDISDDNDGCPVDSSNRITLANRLSPSGIRCLEVPKPNRTMEGIQSTKCESGLEVLVGFRANGTGICKPVNLRKKSG